MCKIEQKFWEIIQFSYGDMQWAEVGQTDPSPVDTF